VTENALIGVGTLAAGTAAAVGTDGTVSMGEIGVGWRLRGAGDWVVPGRDAPARRSRPGPAPVVHTAVRLGSGDVVERVYAAGNGDRATVVVEVANETSEGVAVGFVVDAAGSISADDAGIRVDGKRVVTCARRPGAIEADGRMVAFPVPHRTRVRIAVTYADDVDVDVAALPETETVVRAWDRILERGMRAELPQPLQAEVDAARADLLLASPSAAACAALEDWGFDEEAMRMWTRLGIRDRRRAKRDRGEGVLAATRAALVRESRSALDLVPGFRPAWLGRSLAVHDAPLQGGRCSFAIRWHGARPALLWDVPAGYTVRVPTLDPAWSSADPAGETLLAEPPSQLLSMGQGAAVSGSHIDAPEQFS
jgi:hypothetical protein